jgi:CHRD domain
MQSRTFRALALLLVLSVVIGGLAMVAVAERGQSSLKARLNGANEVPPADPDGTGDARVRFRLESVGVGTGDSARACFSLAWANIEQPDRAHIHRGAAGVNGGIEVAFFDTPGSPVPPNIDSVSGCVTTTPELAREISRNPEGFYVNLHNAAFPGGAIRGQLKD